MYQLYQQPAVATELGWTVYGPLLLMLAMFALGFPIWVSLGFTAIALLWVTEVLPLSLLCMRMTRSPELDTTNWV